MKALKILAILFGFGVLAASVYDYAGAQGYQPFQGSYEEAIAAECAEKGCDAALVTRVMYCESQGVPDAIHYRDDGGVDAGLFQINAETWGDVAWADPYTQIDWATTMIANGGIGHWWPSQHCWG
jgi:hypothetical protein